MHTQGNVFGDITYLWMQGRNLQFKIHERNGKLGVTMSYNNNNIREDLWLALHRHFPNFFKTSLVSLFMKKDNRTHSPVRTHKVRGLRYSLTRDHVG